MAVAAALTKGHGRRRRRHKRRGAINEINMTPFIDVMLVLLIVFMVAAPLMTVGVPLDLSADPGRTPQCRRQAAHLVDPADGPGLLRRGRTAR